MNHIRFPKEDHLTDWACGENKAKKGDRVDRVATSMKVKYCSEILKLFRNISLHLF